MGAPCCLYVHVFNLQKAQALQFSLRGREEKRRPGEAEQPDPGKRGRTGPGSGARISPTRTLPASLHKMQYTINRLSLLQK